MLECSPRVPDRITASQLPELLRLHHDRLRSICWRLCGPEDDIDEILQDTWVEIIRHLHGFRGESSFLTWATAVARSQIHRHRRRRQRYSVRDEAIDLAVRSFPELGGCSERDPEDSAAHERLRAVLDEALSTLPELDRLVFVHRQLDGMTAPEVATHLGLTVSAVKSRLHRARRQLRERLLGDVRLDALN